MEKDLICSRNFNKASKVRASFLKIVVIQNEVEKVIEEWIMQEWVKQEWIMQEWGFEQEFGFYLKYKGVNH